MISGPRLKQQERLGKDFATFEKPSGDRVQSVAADGIVVYAPDESTNDLAYLVVHLCGTALHIAMDRQVARQVRELVADAESKFSAPVPDLQ